MIQLQALFFAAALAAAVLAWWELHSRLARRAALQAGEPAGGEHILYFSGEGCSVCRTHQEPALRALQGVPVKKIDALAEPELARRYHVYTLPTTVVVGADGRPRHVNYGYAPAPKLLAQLRDLEGD